nr:MAG TPA: hypothetical protein [Caudoviricetes sp.]
MIYINGLNLAHEAKSSAHFNQMAFNINTHAF